VPYGCGLEERSILQKTFDKFIGLMLQNPQFWVGTEYFNFNSNLQTVFLMGELK